MSALAIIASILAAILAWFVCEALRAPVGFETHDGFGPVHTPPQTEHGSPELRVQGQAGRVHEHADFLLGDSL